MATKTQPANAERRSRKFLIPPPTPGLQTTSKWVDVHQAARRLNICENTLYNRCKQQLIVYRMNGNAFEFNEVHLDDYEQRCIRNAN